VSIVAAGGLQGTYQEALRAVGAWLDVRGYGEIRIVEDGGVIVVEAVPTGSATAPAPETIRLERADIRRLCQAARQDRGSALSRPLATPRLIDPAMP
jgi:hypothetical protein